MGWGWGGGGGGGGGGGEGGREEGVGEGRGWTLHGRKTILFWEATVQELSRVSGREII